MFSRIEFANNASTRIAKDIQTSENTITVASGETSYFPELPYSDSYFMLTLVDDNGNFEIVKCTAKSDTTFTVERAQEGTTAKFFKQGTTIENRLTAGSITQVFQQSVGTDTEHGIFRIASTDEIRKGVTNSPAPATCTPEKLLPVLNEVKEDASFIKGGIVAFSGRFDGVYPIPTGESKGDTRWHICNGSDGTPDLRNRFIMGCDTPISIGTTGGSNTREITTGPCTLTVAQIPSHNHWNSGNTSPYWAPASSGMSGSYGSWHDRGTSFTGSSQAHTHTVSASDDNRPAYYALAYIIKIK